MILVGGILSDKFGRRTIIMFLMIIHIASTFATAFASSYAMFVGVRVFVGGSVHGIWSIMFVLSTETMPEPMRPINGGIFSMGN